MLQAGDIVEVDGNQTYTGGIVISKSGTTAQKITLRGVRVGGLRHTHPGSVFRLQYCFVHDANGGNNVKSRAERNEIYYNWLEGAVYHELSSARTRMWWATFCGRSDAELERADVDHEGRGSLLCASNRPDAGAPAGAGGGAGAGGAAGAGAMGAGGGAGEGAGGSGTGGGGAGPYPSAAGDEGGCACRASTGSSSSGQSLGLLLAGAWICLRRTRRRLAASSGCRYRLGAQVRCDARIRLPLAPRGSRRAIRRVGAPLQG
jgi:hypothetical protein